MGKNPSNFTKLSLPNEDLKRRPVENVSWDDAQLFLKKLNERDPQSGWEYRLPSEAQWEYACRGGSLADKLESAFSFYVATRANSLLPGQANFVEHGTGWKRTCQVGSYPPNRLGLHDMHGNVAEWCADEVPADPKDPMMATLRATRGGGWDYDSRGCRATNRVSHQPSYQHYNVGLRVARVPSGDPSPDAKTPPDTKSTAHLAGP